MLKLRVLAFLVWLIDLPERFWPLAMAVTAIVLAFGHGEAATFVCFLMLVLMTAEVFLTPAPECTDEQCSCRESEVCS